MPDSSEDKWRDRLSRDKDRDREQIEGFFESRRGQILAVAAVAVFVIILGWNMIAPLFGGGQ